MGEPTTKWRVPAAALAIALPALLALLVYARAPWLGLGWDDAALTVDNPNLRSLHGLTRLWTEDTWKASGLDERTAYFRPVAMTSFWLVARLGGGASWQHLANVLVHATNAALLARILVQRAWASPRRACLLASFWAVATAGSEVALWISGRFDGLVTTFLLAAFLANRPRDADAPSSPWPASWLGAALLTKEVAIAWFPVLIVDDLVTWRRGWRESWRRWAVLAALPLVVLAARHAVGIRSDDALGHALGWAVPAYAAIVMRSSVVELVPVGLDPLQKLALPSLPAALAVLALLVAVVVVAARRARKNASTNADADAAGVALVGAVWFALALLPMCAIPPSEPVAGQRYGYAASIGLLLVMTGLLSWWAGPAASPLRRRATELFLGALVIVHVVLTSLHVPAWQDRASIAASMARVHPDSAHAHYLLGYLALERGDEAEAEQDLARSLALERSWRALDTQCVLELRRGALEAAEAACAESASLAPGNPRVWLNLASIDVRAKRWPQALDAAEHAIALKPRYAEAQYLAGIAAANLGRFPLALAHADAGLDVEPSNERLLGLKMQIARRQTAPRGPAPP